MVIVHYRRPDGREARIRLEVEEEEAVKELRKIEPDAEILSIRKEREPPELPDPDDVARRDWEELREKLIALCRGMLDKKGIACSELTPNETIEKAAPYFRRGARRKILALHRAIQDRLEDSD